MDRIATPRGDHGSDIGFVVGTITITAVVALMLGFWFGTEKVLWVLGSSGLILGILSLLARLAGASSTDDE